MSMEYKAFGFRWNSPRSSPATLATGGIARLVAFIDGNLPTLRDPNAGQGCRETGKSPSPQPMPTTRATSP